MAKPDGHNDFPYMIRGWYKNRVDRTDFDIQNMPIGQTDLTRLTKGMVGGQFWSAFVPWLGPSFQLHLLMTKRADLVYGIFSPTKTDEFSTTTLLDPLLATLQQIDVIHNFISLYPSSFGLATSAREIWSAFNGGRIATLIGVEGLHQICNSVSVLRMFYRLGVRYVTLTHDGNNMWAESAVSLLRILLGDCSSYICTRLERTILTSTPKTAGTTPHGGLSEKGKSLVKEMNRIGM